MHDVRTIVSGSGSITKGIATFVEHHVKQSSISHDTYLHDTPAFLRLISNINKGPKLSNNALIVTLDVERLNINIHQKLHMTLGCRQYTSRALALNGEQK